MNSMNMYEYLLNRIVHYNELIHQKHLQHHIQVRDELIDILAMFYGTEREPLLKLRKIYKKK